MKPPGRSLSALDNLLWVLLCTCGMVGLFALDFSLDALRTFRVPLSLGLGFGLITCPAVTRWLRPRLARRFPGTFGDQSADD